MEWDGWEALENAALLISPTTVGHPRALELVENLVSKSPELAPSLHRLEALRRLLGESEPRYALEIFRAGFEVVERINTPDRPRRRQWARGLSQEEVRRATVVAHLFGLWHRPSRLYRQFQELAVDLAENLATRHGWHLVQAGSRRGEQHPDLDLLALVRAHAANAARIFDDLDGAKHHLNRARLYQPVDEVIRAEVLSLEASVCRHTRDFDGARRAAERAVALYSTLDPHLTAANQLLLAQIVWQGYREFEAALGLVDAAVREVDAVREPRVAISSRVLLAKMLVEKGRAEEARRALPAAAAVAGDYERSIRSGVEARILVLEERYDEAAELLTDAIQFFQETSRRLEASYHRLDLARCRAHLGDTRGAARLALESAWVFEEAELEAESSAALGLLADALKLDTDEGSVCSAIGHLASLSAAFFP